MTDAGTRHSPLADFGDRLAGIGTVTGGAVKVREIRFSTQVDVRAAPGAAGAIGAALGVELPIEPTTVTAAADRRALWLGPDEWLVVGPDGSAAGIEAAVRDALGPDGSAMGAVVDVSANRVMIELAGSGARDILEGGCTLDLHPRAFGPGRCASTILARAAVIIEQLDDAPTFLLYVRPSFAPYIAEWLVDAAAGVRTG